MSNHHDPSVPGRSDNPAQASPKRVLGSWAALAVVAGSMLGIGIFIYPPEVAKALGSPGPFFAVWALGGIFALAGAVAYAELGTMFPRAGGDYEFLRESFGPSLAFAAGWTIFGAAFTGSIAAMAVALATYQLPMLLQAIPGFGQVDVASQLVQGPFGWTLDGTRLLAVTLVLAISALNALGLRASAWLQYLTTIVPMVLLAGISVWALGWGPSPQPVPALPSSASPSGALGYIDAFVTSYMAVYFAYAGWNAVIYVAGEVRDPGVVIPRALLGGTASVTALYLVLCAGFLKVFGTRGLAQAGEAGSALAGILGGTPAKLGMTVLIAAAIVSSLNGTVLGGARVAYAMAKQRAFWSWAGHLDSRHNVPRRALVLQAVWSCAFILSGTFDGIYRLTSLAMVVGGSITVVGLYVLRKRRPDQLRPYRATGYPWLPALYVASSAIVVAVMVKRAFSGEANALYPMAGLAITVLAFGVHYARRATTSVRKSREGS